MTDAPTPRQSGCCRKPARVLLIAGGWFVAASAALSLAAIPFDAGESMCGVWGCYPPLNALLAMHLFWGVTLAAAATIIAQRPKLVRPLGLLLTLAALAGLATVVGLDLPRWLALNSDAYRQFWPQRVAYSILTLTDVPLLPALAAGLWCLTPPTPSRVMTTKLTVCVAILLAAIGLSAVVSRAPTPALAASETADKPILAPEFVGITDWVNTKPLKLADQKGKVVMVHFWTNGCINCIHNYPHYRVVQDKYKDATDFLIVGVHTPEFDAEKNVPRIKERMAKNKLTFPVAVDNDSKTWQAWGNRYWPCVYLVDKSGNVRQRYEGELGADGEKRLIAAIDELRAEPAPSPE